MLPIVKEEKRKKKHQYREHSNEGNANSINQMQFKMQINV